MLEGNMLNEKLDVRKAWRCKSLKGTLTYLRKEIPEHFCCDQEKRPFVKGSGLCDRTVL